MEQGNGRGVFYGVIGVATLIVAIVGATFAYFSASATNSNVIVGNTSEASNLELTVTKLAADGGLIPMFDADLGKGMTGEDGNCIDKNGNTVCHVYQIALKNGKSPVSIDGSVSFTSDATNVVYNVVAQAQDSINSVAGLASIAGTSTTGTLYSSSTNFTTAAYTADETKYYYVVVWLRDTNTAQEDVDASKSYTGTVTFNAAGGTGVTATFSS